MDITNTNLLIREFKEENRPLLASLDTGAALREEFTPPRSPHSEIENHTAFQTLFLTIQRIKASAGFLRLSPIVTLCGALERVLIRLRDERAVLSMNITEALHSGFSKLELLLEDAETCDQLDISAELNLLHASAPEGMAGQAATCAFDPDIDEAPAGADTPTRIDQDGRDHEQAEKPPEGQPSTVETIRLGAGLINEMMNLAGELVLGRNQLRRLLEKRLSRHQGLEPVLQNVDLVVTEIQEQILQLRMQPLGSILNRLPRLNRDLCRTLGKKAELVLDGIDVEIDKSILDVLMVPLTRLVANALEHGIEKPAERKTAGKGEIARLQIIAGYKEGQVSIVISDDGRGIDPKAAVSAAVGRGVIDSGRAAVLTDTEKVWLLLHPRMSASEKDETGFIFSSVRQAVEGIGGRMVLENRPGSGLTTRLRIPMTRTIIPSLLVRTGGLNFAVPQVDIQELICIQPNETPTRIERIGDSDALRFRNGLLPLVRLAEVLDILPIFFDPHSGKRKVDRRVKLADRRGLPNHQEDDEISAADQRQEASPGRRFMRAGDVFVMIMKVGANRYGLVVDELLNTEDIVVKPLSSHIQDVRCYSGTTILGDGSVALILSASGLAETAKLQFSELDAEWRKRSEKKTDSETRQDSGWKAIWFNHARDEFLAVPLASTARLELITPRTIRMVGNREYITYGDRGLPLIRLDRHFPIGPMPENLEELYVIIPKVDSPRIGFLASNVVDIIDVTVSIHQEEASRPGEMGSAMIRDKQTLFFNPVEWLIQSGDVLESAVVTGQQKVNG